GRRSPAGRTGSAPPELPQLGLIVLTRCLASGPAGVTNLSQNQVARSAVTSLFLGHDLAGSSESHEGNENDTGGSNAFPSDLALGNAEKLLENQQLEIQSRLSHLENVAAPESALSSCTMVEGLLFPVEYYVRTTRRMSNCQRKVDLDAVILSQLGRSKKGQRSKCKQKDADSNQPSQETVENDLESAVVPFPFLCTENDPGNSSSPQKTFLTSNESKRGPDHQMDSEGAASLGLPATDAGTSSSLFSFRSHQWLVPKLGIEEFHLPDEEFGLLKLEKCESSPVNDLEAFVPSVFGDGLASEDVQAAEMKAEEKGLNRNLISPLKSGSPKSSHLESPASKMELSTHELLFTPVGTISTGAPVQPESHISSSIFPVLGATPAVLPSVCSELLPSTCSVPPLPVSPRSSQEAPAQVMGDWGMQRLCHSTALGQLWLPNVIFEVEFILIFYLFVQKKNEAERSTPVLFDDLAEENLQFVSKLQDSSSSCAVDVSTVWWEAAGCRELCVVTACENSVSLWKPLAPDHWGKVYTWQLGEIPVIQIIPLLDTCNLICIALGNLEIGEIRLLLYSSESDSFKQSLVKTGNIKAVLGLKERRLVSSSRSMQEQEVEVVSFSETGRSKHGQTLMPPEETVLAFAEVEGVKDALLGTTAVNSIVVWNLKTGQLLKKMHIGYSYPASICHRAYSDSGLLFVVLSHPHAKESESCGNPAFRVIAFNPKTARSTGVIFSSLPPGHVGRYVEGEVKDALAAAVLSSGAIAVWDLLLGRCTALLPPGPAGSWALVRWSAAGAGLLAGRGDGGVCLYRYRAPRAPAS
uniref:Partner and localizer of BRCA2 n=1 Tax=Anas platyrhynchos TaxID=8839 RepID=A0A8B9R404_ANAPL